MRAGETLVPLGVIAGAHGLRGELRVKPYNPSSELLPSLERARLRPAGGAAAEAREARVLGAHWHGAMLLLAIEGCGDRDAAQALRGFELCVPRADMPALAAGEHYLVDLIGLQAKTRDGRTLGEVVEAVEYPASQVLRVAVEGGAIEVPLRDPYVVEIRLDEGTLIVDHVEELDLEPARKRPR
jgi:16S rRNA processing protein RimM